MFNNPQYNSIKIALAIVFIVGVGFFALNSMHKNALDNTGRVIEQNTPNISGPLGSGTASQAGQIPWLCAQGGNPWIHVTSPKNKEYMTTTYINVLWTSCNIPTTANVSIKLIPPASWGVPNYTLAAATPNDGNFNTGTFTLDPQFAPLGPYHLGKWYKVMVTSGGVSGSSDGLFAIDNGSVLIIPNQSSVQGFPLQTQTQLDVTFKVKALTHDIYLDKDVAASPITSGGNYFQPKAFSCSSPCNNVFTEIPYIGNLSSGYPTMTVFSGSPVVLTNTYKIAQGTTAEFKFTYNFFAPTNLHPFHAYMGVLPVLFSWDYSDVNGKETRNMDIMNPPSTVFGYGELLQP